MADNILFTLKSSGLPTDEELMRISENQLNKSVLDDRPSQHTPRIVPEIPHTSVQGTQNTSVGYHYESLSPIPGPSIVQEPAGERPDSSQNIDVDIREVREERPTAQQRNLAVRVSILFFFQYQNYIIRM